MWTLVVPLKPLAQAKSRLAPQEDPSSRRSLALAFAQDTVAAALACPAVRGVVVVTDDAAAGAALRSLGARVVPDGPGLGLNPALAHGADLVRAERPDAAVGALNADLPALRPGELARVLGAARHWPRAFLPDAEGVGTTLLTVLPGRPLAPEFGAGSRRRHRASGAVEITAAEVPSVRRDVDTGSDLAEALALGVGPYTLRTSAASRG